LFKNKATKLLKTLGSVPETDTTNPILGEADWQREAWGQIAILGKESGSSRVPDKKGPQETSKQSHRFVDDK
jgi:hypothetical protein